MGARLLQANELKEMKVQRLLETKGAVAVIPARAHTHPHTHTRTLTHTCARPHATPCTPCRGARCMRIRSHARLQATISDIEASLEVSSVRAYAAVAGADVAESRRRCGRVPAQMWCSSGADVGRP